MTNIVKITLTILYIKKIFYTVKQETYNSNKIIITAITEIITETTI